MIWQLLDARTFSGIEKHVEVMCEALNANGHACTIVLLTQFDDHPFRARLEASNTPHMVLKGGYKALKQAITLHKPTLIHTHGYKAGIYGRIAGSNVYSTFHSGERGAFPVWLYQLIDEKTAFLAKQNFAVSSLIQARVKNSVVLDNFIPVKPICDKKSLPKVIAFVGRLSHEKAPDIFCEIAALLPDYQFRIYGDGAMRNALEERYSSFIDFRGFTANMAAEWAEIGVLLMPSRAEGLPMAALEAMAEGVPVVASHVGALPDVTPYIFDVGKVNEAIGCITTVFNAKNQSEIIRKAHNHIFTHYNAENAIKKIIKLYGLD
jgi:glycosyltransferase involved in cell wall biosynthesis